MRVVFDVGMFVSATIRADGHPAQALNAWRDGQFELVSSPPILDELRRVLAYPRIRKRHRLSDEEISSLVNAIGDAAHLTPSRLDLRAVPDDPDDDKIVACAVEGEADCIVASDEHLLALVRYEGIPIVPPRRFLEMLD